MAEAASLQRLVEKTFAKEDAYLAYCDWNASRVPGDCEKAFLSAVPVLGVSLRIFFQNPARYVEDEELISYAALILYERIRSCRFQDGNDIAYFSWLLKTSKYAMMKASARASAQIFDTNGEVPRGRVMNQRDAEFRVFIDELPNVIIDYFLSENRFSGDADKACRHILGRLLKNRRVVPKLIATYFGIENPKLLIDYVLITIRRCLYEFRDDLHHGNVIDDWYDWFMFFVPDTVDDAFDEGEECLMIG